MTHSTTTSMALEPFFCGSSDQRLFACYHEPAEPARDCGVVICYPIWQEYIRSHRACFNLAQNLARAGFPVLRFDYAGSGDSAGDAEGVDLDHWKADIVQAINELRERAGVSMISLVGLRLGASLAAMVATEYQNIASLVLWDPVVNGRHYLAETTHLHQNAIRFFFTQPKQGTEEQRPSELLGFPLSPRLIEGLEELDLLTIRRRLTRNLLIVESHTGEPAQQLAEQIQPFAAQVDYQHIPGFRIWTEHTDKGLVPHNVLSAIVSWMSEVHQ
ncbi:MAG: alpha/beta fold hydrolase [Chloroflexaceae bacterium]